MDMLDKFLPRKDFDSYEDFFNNLKVEVPQNFNFAWDVMDELAETKPNQRAMLWCDEKGAEAEFTYAEIKQRTNQAANTLIAGGIKKGDPIMLILKRRYEYWFILLALHKIGAIAIPATHLLTKKDIVYRCKAASIKGIICVDDLELISRVDEAQAEMESESAKECFLAYKAFTRSAHNANATIDSPASWVDFNITSSKASEKLEKPAQVNINDDIMLLYFTSGTTGMPKMVRHNFAYPLGHIVTARYWHQVIPGGLHITIADSGWAKSAWGNIYGQWIAGTGLFVYDHDRFVPKEMLEVITKYKVNTFCAPPTIYRFFIKEDLKQYDFSSLKHCTVAGEALNPEIYEQFKAGTGLALHECYGQTELTVTMCTIYPWIKPKTGSMGKPAPGYDIDLLKDDGTSCQMGEEGELVVRTHKSEPLGMFGGYYRDEKLTNSVWHGDIYYTGDVAWRDEDGYYWFVGRNDDVIKSSGYRIGPFEVESVLQEHASVLECAVTGVPDPDRGSVVKATVVLAQGWVASEELKTELQNHVKKTTAPYKYPRVIEFVKELPKTISGKIRRVEIRQEDGV